jgi:hypothetical protein|tara:strand:+ start:63 stop:236 length:174 start_codon:yes stop_codon:yes gene_type:complete
MADCAMNEEIKIGFDATSLAVVGATLASWLPATAAVLSIVWTVIRIRETKTYRKWRK